MTTSALKRLAHVNKTMTADASYITHLRAQEMAQEAASLESCYQAIEGACALAVDFEQRQDRLSDREAAGFQHTTAVLLGPYLAAVSLEAAEATPEKKHILKRLWEWIKTTMRNFLMRIKRLFGLAERYYHKAMGDLETAERHLNNAVDKDVKPLSGTFKNVFNDNHLVMTDLEVSKRGVEANKTLRTLVGYLNQLDTTNPKSINFSSPADMLKKVFGEEDGSLEFGWFCAESSEYSLPTFKKMEGKPDPLFKGSPEVKDYKLPSLSAMKTTCKLVKKECEKARQDRKFVQELHDLDKAFERWYQNASPEMSEGIRQMVAMTLNVARAGSDVSLKLNNLHWAMTEYIGAAAACYPTYEKPEKE